MLNYLGDTLYRSPHNSTHQAGNLKTGIDLIFEEQPYLANVYPGDTRRIGIVFTVRDMEIEYSSLGVNPIFRETYRIGSGIIRPKGFFIACIVVTALKYALLGQFGIGVTKDVSASAKKQRQQCHL